MTFLVLIYAIFLGLVVWLGYDLIDKLGKRGRPTLPTVPPMPEVKPPREETRYIETDMGDCSFAWVCEQCGDARCFDYPLTDDKDFHFCPKCGRKIIEFVEYIPRGLLPWPR